jgi:hypothetical protein
MRSNTMWVLILILTPTGVMADGPAKAEAEVAVERLDMRGKWEGKFLFVDIEWKAEITDGKLRMHDKGKPIAAGDWIVSDEGHGKLRIQTCPGKIGRGIYKVEGDRVTICFSDMPDPRPKEYRVTKKQAMYILNRVKPGKR